MDDQSLLDPPFLKLHVLPPTAPTEKIICSPDKGWPVTVCVLRVYRGKEERIKLPVLVAKAQLLCDGINISKYLKIDCESKTDPSPSLQFPSDDGYKYFTICDGIVKLSIKVMNTKELNTKIPDLYSEKHNICIKFYGSSMLVNPCTLSGIQIKSRTRRRRATTTSSSTPLAEKPLNKEEPKQFSYWMNKQKFTYPFEVENISPSPCNPPGGRKETTVSESTSENISTAPRIYKMQLTDPGGAHDDVWRDLTQGVTGNNDGDKEMILRAANAANKSARRARAMNRNELVKQQESGFALATWRKKAETATAASTKSDKGEIEHLSNGKEKEKNVAARENRKKRKLILQIKGLGQPTNRQRTASEKTEHESTKRSLQRKSKRERELVILKEHPYDTLHAMRMMDPTTRKLDRSLVSWRIKTGEYGCDGTTLNGCLVDGGNPQDYTYTSLHEALTAATRKGGVVLMEADRGLNFIFGCGIAAEWYYVSGLLQRSEFYLMDIDDRHIAMAEKRLEYIKTKLKLQLVDRIHLGIGDALELYDGLAPQYPLWDFWIKDDQKFDEELTLSKYWLVWTTTPITEVVATIVDSLFELDDYTPFISWMDGGDTTLMLAGLTEQMALVFSGLDYSVTTGKPLKNGGARPGVFQNEIDRINLLSIKHSLVFTQSEGKTVSLTVLIIQNAEQFHALKCLRRRTVARRDEAEVMKTLPDRNARYARLKELDIPVPRPKQKTLEEALVHAEGMTVIQLKKAVRERKLLSSSECNKLRRAGLVKVVQDSIRQQYIIISSSPEEAFTNWPSLE